MAMVATGAAALQAGQSAEARPNRDLCNMLGSQRCWPHACQCTTQHPTKRPAAPCHRGGMQVQSVRQAYLCQNVKVVLMEDPPLCHSTFEAYDCRQLWREVDYVSWVADLPDVQDHIGEPEVPRNGGQGLSAVAEHPEVAIENQGIAEFANGAIGVLPGFQLRALPSGFQANQLGRRGVPKGPGQAAMQAAGQQQHQKCELQAGCAEGSRPYCLLGPVKATRSRVAGPCMAEAPLHSPCRKACS